MDRGAGPIVTRSRTQRWARAAWAAAASLTLFAAVAPGCGSDECDPATYQEHCDHGNHTFCASATFGGHSITSNFCERGCCGNSCGSGSCDPAPAGDASTPALDAAVDAAEDSAAADGSLVDARGDSPSEGAASDSGSE